MIDPKTAEIRVTRKYEKLYEAVTELVKALQHLEPGHTVVDEAAFRRKPDGKLQIAYKARPTILSIIDGGKRFTLRVDEVHDKQ